MHRQTQQVFGKALTVSQMARMAILSVHNPGLFKDVPSLRSGSQVSVCDSTGAYQVYQVIDVFDVSRDTYLHQIEDRISGYGESIVIQTCLPNAYRVVVAQSI